MDRSGMFIAGAMLAGILFTWIVRFGDGPPLSAFASRLPATVQDAGIGSGQSGAGAGGHSTAGQTPSTKAVPTAEPPGCASSACHVAVKHHPQLHPPVDQDQCDACHVPKPGATPHRPGLRHEFAHVAGNAELCYECHDPMDENDHVHKPVGQGLCFLCHDPHGSKHKFLLRVDRYLTLCKQCHRLESIKGQYVHQPVAQGQCGACHEYHGSDNRRLLKGAYTAKRYESFDLKQYALCYGCHDSKQVTEPTTATATQFRNGNVNLHFKHVNRKEKGVTCNACHLVHAGNDAALVGEQIPGGKQNNSLQFKQTATGGSCLTSCHRKWDYDRVKPVQNK